jgi:hypothetical protein
MKDIKSDFKDFLREKKETIIDEILVTKSDYEEAKEIFNQTKSEKDYEIMKTLGEELLSLSPANTTVKKELRKAKHEIIN